MKALLQFIALPMFLLAFVSVAHDFGRQEKEEVDYYFVPKGFLTGDKYLKMTERRQADYAMGIVDGFMTSTLFGAKENMVRGFSTCLERMTSDQLAAIIRKHLNDNPQVWHHQLNVEVHNAFLEVCPALKQNPR